MRILLPLFLSLGALGSLANPVIAPAPDTYLRDFCTALDVTWPKNKTQTIVCHGHSVPAGYFKTPVVDTFNAYPHLLHRALKEAHPHAVLNVTVTAIGGENSLSGAARFEKDVLLLRPDVVLIDYGLNDRHLPPAQTRQAWRSMIEHAKSAGVKVILLTPTGDTSAKMDDPQDPLSQQAEQIRQLARDTGVGLADSYAAFLSAINSGKPLADLMSQVNHPNRHGHDLVVAELMKWFRAT